MMSAYSFCQMTATTQRSTEELSNASDAVESLLLLQSGLGSPQPPTMAEPSRPRASSMSLTSASSTRTPSSASDQLMRQRASSMSLLSSARGAAIRTAAANAAAAGRRYSSGSSDTRSEPGMAGLMEDTGSSTYYAVSLIWIVSRNLL